MKFIQQIRNYLSAGIAEARSAHSSLKPLRDFTGGVSGWLKNAHRAQLVLIATVVLAVWVVPWLMESLLELVLPSSTKSSGFLGMSKRRVAHPAIEPTVLVFTIATWSAGLVCLWIELWRELPGALSRIKGRQSSIFTTSAEPSPAELGETLVPSLASPTGGTNTTAATVMLGGQESAASSTTPTVTPDHAPLSVPGSTPTSLDDRYQIERQLGEGGMGQVFLAEDTKLGRQVALKKLPAELVTEDSMRQRFRREARALAQLNHQNVVQLFDFIEEGNPENPDAMWMVMEVVSGGDLEELLAAGVPSLAELRRLGLEMAAALEVAHERGIVHRDFKPANVMLSSERHAKVTDFGIAKLEMANATADTKLTQAGSVMGTPSYMSPEQALGQEVGPASDVYALGATFYEMISGAPVFAGTLTQVLAAHITTTPSDFSELEREVPADLEALVLDMLKKEPADRPQLQEVQERLKALTLE